MNSVEKIHILFLFIEVADSTGYTEMTFIYV